MANDERLDPVYDLGLGGQVILHDGPLVVTTSRGELTGTGSVRFEWHAGFRVEATVTGRAPDMSERPVRLRLPDDKTLDVLPAFSDRTMPAGSWMFVGHADPTVHGDPAAPLDRLVFHPANYPQSTFGTEGEPDFRTRTIGDGWELTLDVLPDYTARMRDARLSRGGTATHVGQLRRADGSPFTWEDASTPLDASRFLLSFASGHRVPPLLAVGFAVNGRRVVEEWGAYRRDAFGGVLNWCSSLIRGDAVAQLWPRVLDLWADTADRQLLTVALELYLDAQKGRNIETRLVSAQAGLELLAWHHLTRREPRLRPDVVDGERAPARMRRLLERIGVDQAVPESLPALRSALPAKDGPSAVCAIRNRIIHPTDLPGLFQLEADARHGALRLATWYLELAILRLLDYSGSHLNQTMPLPIFDGQGDPVPWSSSAG